MDVDNITIKANTKQAINRFSATLAASCLSSQTDNMCISPIGFYVTLAALCEGAAGKTAVELKQVLGTYDFAALETLWKKLRDNPTGSFVSEITGPLPLLSPKYKEMLHAFAFRLRDEKGMRFILKNHLKSLARWPERPEQCEESFYFRPYEKRIGNGYRCRCLKHKHVNCYKNDKHCMNATIPFGNGLALTLAMPKEVSLQEFWRGSGCLYALMPVDTAVAPAEVIIPHFHIETEIAAHKMLPQMGVEQAFDAARADFSGMIASGARGFFVKSCAQSVQITVDENGATAQAETWAETIALCLQPRLMFDHPFAFAIWDENVGIPLFIGSLYHAAEISKSA